jgi:hypothetical protein
MNFNVWGPCSMKRNDLYCLSTSGLDDQIFSIQEDFFYDEGIFFKIYGDSAYCVSGYSCILARHDIEHISDRDTKDRCKLENRVLSSCRQAIEWDYGELYKLFPLVHYKSALKMRKMNVSKMFVVALMLRNAHVCCNGGLATSYFGIRAPSIET